jgi:hypothetical protein
MEGVGVQPNHTMAREPGPLYFMNYSLINRVAYSVCVCVCGCGGGGGD